MRIKSKMGKRVVQRFKFMFFGLIAVVTGNLLVSAVNTARYAGYEDSVQNTFSRGQIVEYADDEDFCHSYVLLPGVPLIHKSILIIAYLLALIYLFLGIAIIADIFMGSIEVITSQTRSVKYEDDNGVPREANISVWNPTIANLTLMALGSSAPEILLS